MRSGPHLVTSRLRDYRPVGVHGEPAYLSYAQIVATVQNRLGKEYADYFARPEVDAAGTSISWHAQCEGNVRRWADLDPAEQARLHDVTTSLTDRLADLLVELQLDEGQSRAAHRLSDLLEAAFNAPDSSCLFFVDDQPVQALWGFQGEGESFTIHSLLPAAATVATDTVETPASSPSPPPPVAPTRRWRWWWLILLLILALLLAWLLKSCVTEELLIPPVTAPPIDDGTTRAEAEKDPDIRRREIAVPVLRDGELIQQQRSDEVLAEPVGPAPDQTEVLPVQEDGVAPDDSVLPVQDAPPAAQETENQATPEAESEITPAPEPEPEAAPDPAPEPAPEPEPPPPPEPDPTPEPEPPTIPEQEPVPAPLPPPPPKSDPSAGDEPPGGGSPLKIPRDNAKSGGDVQFMEGQWRSGGGIRDRATGKPLQQQYQFDKSGSGEVTITRSDGSVCRGKASTQRTGENKVRISELGPVQCPDGRTFKPSVTDCQRGASGRAICRGVNSDGSSYKVEINR